MGLVRGDALAQPSECADPSIKAIVERVPSRRQLRLHHHRHEDLHWLADFDAVEPCLRDADDRERVAVDGGRSTDDGGIGTEPRCPEGVAQHGDWIGALQAIVGWRDESSNGRPDAQHREVAPGDDLPGGLVGLPLDADVQVVAEAAEHAGKDLVVVAELGIHGIRQLAAIAPVVAVLAAFECHLDELLRVLHRE